MAAAVMNTDPNGLANLACHYLLSDTLVAVVALPTSRRHLCEAKEIL
jgi:hypothetical protein